MSHQRHIWLWRWAGYAICGQLAHPRERAVSRVSVVRLPSLSGAAPRPSPGNAGDVGIRTYLAVKEETRAATFHGLGQVSVSSAAVDWGEDVHLCCGLKGQKMECQQQTSGTAHLVYNVHFLMCMYICVSESIRATEIVEEHKGG